MTKDKIIAMLEETKLEFRAAAEKGDKAITPTLIQITDNIVDALIEKVKRYETS